jgi:hypothetical protein
VIVAGDWIKMRTDLYRDPKVCVMADLLMADDSELSSFVNQQKQRNMTVTRNVTRCACVGALLSVWGVLRHRGKRVGDDLCCAFVTLAVIDDISDIPGFGDVMEHVGWAKQTDEGITLPRFFSEYNADPADKQKTPAAERQARYRRNKMSQAGATQTVTKSVTPTVTRDVTVTPREEKSREEKDTAGAVSVAVATPRPKRGPFVPPTVEQVAAYVTEINAGIDPGRFVDHYTARDWVLNNGRKVVDWKACVRTWMGKDYGTSQGSIRPAAGNGQAGGLFTREHQREAANKAALVEFLQSEGVCEGNLGFDQSQANVGLHGRPDQGLVLRLEAIPGDGHQSVGGRASNVGDAIPGVGRPVSEVSRKDAQGLLPDG